MPGTELLLAFFIATAVFAYMPGPATLYTAAQTIARGRRGGLLAAAGIHVGGYVHVIAATLGLAALFAAVPVLYAVLKLVGAAYLVWLGAQFLLQQATTAQFADSEPLQAPAFWQSATVEILNPKTALFYVAFLPQFTDAAASLPLWSQLLILGTIVNLLFSSADLLVVFLAEKLTATLRESPRANRLARRIGGTILIGLGANLALTR